MYTWSHQEKAFVWQTLSNRKYVPCIIACWLTICWATLFLTHCSHTAHASCHHLITNKPGSSSTRNMLKTQHCQCPGALGCSIVMSIGCYIINTPGWVSIYCMACTAVTWYPDKTSAIDADHSIYAPAARRKNWTNTVMVLVTTTRPAWLR